MTNRSVWRVLAGSMDGEINLEIFARNTSGRTTCDDLSMKETTPTMKKLIIVTPLLAVATALLTSCTTVVEKPVPATTTTTQTTVRKAPAPVSTTTQESTTIRSGGY